MGGRHKRLMDRASSCPLPLLMVAIAGHRPGTDHFFKGSKILFEGLFCFLFVNIQASRCPGEREVVFGCTGFGRLALGLCSLLAGLAVLRPRAKALCVLQEGAHGWLVDDG